VKSPVGIRWSWPLLVSGLCVLAGAGSSVETKSADTSHKAVAVQAEDLSDHMVVLMFDDGWHCVFTDAYPLLKEHGMTAVLPLISDYVGKSLTPHRTGTPYGYMNRAEVKEMIDSLGIEIASHTKSHPLLTRLSDEAVGNELRQSRRALEAMFGREVTSFVYPYGDYDNRVRRLVAEAGYSVARSITPGTVNLAERPYDLSSSEVRKTTSLGAVQGWIAKKPVQILFFHRIVASPGNYTDWSRSRFAELLDWLEERNVQVVTLQDLYRNRRLPGPAILATRRSWRNRIEWDLLEEIDVDITGPAKRR